MLSEAAAPGAAAQAARPAKADPVTVELVRNGLVALAGDMTRSLVRAAYSPNATQMKDFSLGLYDAEGGCIVQAPNAAPIACADLTSVVRRGLTAFKDEPFQPGDVVISNDSASNGQHVSGMVVYSPVFSGTALLAFAAVRVRWVDVGGMAIGSAASQARDVFSEGIQLPFVKLWRAGVPDGSLLRIVTANTRFPERVMGDLRAQIGACKLGESRFLELVGRHGREAVVACVQRIWDEAEAMARKAVETIPDGVYEAACELDNDGIRLDRPIPLRAKVTVSGSHMTVDFSDTADQVEGPYNSRMAETIARVAFKYATTPRVPANEGLFRCLTTICPEGKIINAHPSAPRGWFSMPVLSSLDLVLKALHTALPERIPAGCADNVSLAQLSGTHPGTGRLFQSALPYLGGWGARAKSDGTSALVSLIQGDVCATPIEVQETLEPVRIRRLALRTDSGGAGAQRGGLGIVLEREAVADLEYHGRYERTRDAPWGLAGGKPGEITRAVIRAADGKERVPPLKCEYFAVHKGDTEVVMTAGGGGYGAPWQRDPALVRRDVQDGYVGREAAAEEYGVVLDAKTGEVDTAATQKRRSAMGGK